MQFEMEWGIVTDGEELWHELVFGHENPPNTVHLHGKSSLIWNTNTVFYYSLYLNFLNLFKKN